MTVNGWGWLYLDEHLDATSQILSHHVCVESLDLPLHKPLGVAVCHQPGLWHLQLPWTLGEQGQGLRHWRHLPAGGVTTKDLQLPSSQIMGKTCV